MIYFDNAATTLPCESAVRAMNETAGLYNPSSMYSLGVAAEKRINEAAYDVCALLAGAGAVAAQKSYIKELTDRVIFTSGGTEANNAAVFSAAGRAAAGRTKRIITNKAEHPSVLACFEELAKRGYETVYLDLTESGEINIDELKEAINENTALVSAALVNGETGVINPIEKMAATVKEKNKNTLFHCDAVQAFGKTDVSGLLGTVDFISVSAHKIRGVKGVGALYIKRGVNFSPLIFGGAQQKGRRSGTENVAGIAAFGAAALDAAGEMDKDREVVREIKEYIKKSLTDDFDDIYVNGSENSSPYILNVSVTGVKGETLLHALEAEGVFISVGTACSSREKKRGAPEAYGLPERRTQSAVRLSFCGQNTLDEAEIFVNTLARVLPRLRKYGGINK